VEVEFTRELCDEVTKILKNVDFYDITDSLEFYEEMSKLPFTMIRTKEELMDKILNLQTLKEKLERFQISRFLMTIFKTEFSTEPKIINYKSYYQKPKQQQPLPVI